MSYEIQLNGFLSFAERCEPEMYAEIGVKKGAFVRLLLEHVPSISEYHLIDPWSENYLGGLETIGGIPKRFGQTKRDRWYEMVKRIPEEFPEEDFFIHRMTSEEAVKGYPDGCFDIVFIDGDHSTEAVKKDIELWMPKVRSGGYLTGDDYQLDEDMGKPRVRAAVDELLPHAEVFLGRVWGVQIP